MKKQVETVRQMLTKTILDAAVKWTIKDLKKYHSLLTDKSIECKSVKPKISGK